MIYSRNELVPGWPYYRSNTGPPRFNVIYTTENYGREVCIHCKIVGAKMNWNFNALDALILPHRSKKEANLLDPACQFA